MHCTQALSALPGPSGMSDETAKDQESSALLSLQGMVSKVAIVLYIMVVVLFILHIRYCSASSDS